MIILATTADVIRLVTTSANALDVHASYVDNQTATATPYTPGRQNTAIAAAATTTVLSAPAASTQRQLKKLTANARGGANTVTVEYFDGTTAFRALQVTLAASETLEYEDLTGWIIHDATGAVKTAAGVVAGRLLRAPQYLTSGTSINHPTGTALIKVYGVGGGGAGGGVNAAAQAIGACGGSATYGEKIFVAGAASSTYVVGAAGVGVSGGAGGNGTASTFTHNGTTVTLPFGVGAGTTAGGATLKSQAGGPGGGAATNADFSINGQGGGDAVNNGVAAPIFSAHSGPGGGTPLGLGGMGRVTVSTQAAGAAGTGFGAGGAGILNGTTATALAGANGTQGIWIVEEYS